VGMDKRRQRCGAVYLRQFWPGLSLSAALGAFAVTETLALRAGVEPSYTVLGGIYAFVGTLAIMKSGQRLFQALVREADVASEVGADPWETGYPPKVRRMGVPEPGAGPSWSEPRMLDQQAASESRAARER